MRPAEITIHPATPERKADVFTVFADCAEGRKCWCAYWYLSNKAYQAGSGEENRARLDSLIDAGKKPGLVAYAAGKPAAWAGLGPREWYDRLERSKPLARLAEDDFGPGELWSINCFIVKKAHRKSGLMHHLIGAAVDFAAENGARVLEAYPVDADRKLTNWDLFLGTRPAFEAAGFAEVARRLPSRPIMRRVV